jgi:hypothetical protein
MRSPTEIGARVVAQARSQSIILALFGGVGVEMRCRAAWEAYPALARTPADVDIAGYANQEERIEGLLKELGCVGARELNFLYSGRRLFYLLDAVRIDVVLDRFEMCHSWSLRGRLQPDLPTLSLSDLVLTKLQVVEMAEKDLQDTVALLLESAGRDSYHELTDVLDVEYITGTCGTSWGFWHTVTRNLVRIKKAMVRYDLSPKDRERVTHAIATLQTALVSAPKGFWWRLRSLVGERIRWYQVPEEPVAIFDTKEVNYEGEGRGHH